VEVSLRGDLDLRGYATHLDGKLRADTCHGP
jgi:hypothetical protein